MAPTVRLNWLIRCADPRQCGLDAPGQRVGLGDVDRLHVERRDRLVGDAEQLPRHADLHDDRRVGDERAGLVEADDRELLAADPQGLPDGLGRAVGVGELAGDLRADHDVLPADVPDVEEPPPAALPGQERHGEQGALELEVLGQVLALDHVRVGEALEPLLPGPRQQPEGRGPEAAPAVDGRGDLPDLGRHDAHARDRPQRLRHVGGQVAEDRARRILAQDHQALHLAEGAPHQVADALRDAEQAEEGQDRDRQADRREGRARGARDQVLPGEGATWSADRPSECPRRREHAGRSPPTANPSSRGLVESRRPRRRPGGTGSSSVERLQGGADASLVLRDDLESAQGHQCKGGAMTTRAAILRESAVSGRARARSPPCDTSPDQVQGPGRGAGRHAAISKPGRGRPCGRGVARPDGNLPVAMAARYDPSDSTADRPLRPRRSA